MLQMHRPYEIDVKGEYARRLRRRAEAGKANTMWGLANWRNLGRGMRKDACEEISWRRKATEAGDICSTYKIGPSPRQPTGVEGDHGGAARWWRKAAGVGDVRSMCRLANCPRDGTGVENEAETAATCLRKAAETGGNASMGLLGTCPRRGTGVGKDGRRGRRYGGTPPGEVRLVQWTICGYARRPAKGKMWKGCGVMEEGGGGRQIFSVSYAAFCLEAGEGICAGLPWCWKSTESGLAPAQRGLRRLRQ
jgi:hypothetical protein